MSYAIYFVMKYNLSFPYYVIPFYFSSSPCFLVAIYSYDVTNFCTCIFMKHFPGIWPGICGSFSIGGTVGDNTFWLANPEVGMGK
jgi:hypothetical protein